MVFIDSQVSGRDAIELAAGVNAELGEDLAQMAVRRRRPSGLAVTTCGRRYQED
jgi:hypothetical protein